MGWPHTRLRSWLGRNAVHEAGVVLDRLRAYLPRVAEVDGLLYREGLNAVGIRGGVAGNVIPDECVVTVNYRFAPDRMADEAVDHLRSVFNGYEVTVVDSAARARPGLDHPVAAAFIAAIGRAPAPKQGWTDVARFSELGDAGGQVPGPVTPCSPTVTTSTARSR